MNFTSPLNVIIYDQFDVQETTDNNGDVKRE